MSWDHCWLKQAHHLLARPVPGVRPCILIKDVHVLGNSHAFLGLCHLCKKSEQHSNIYLKTIFLWHLTSLEILSRKQEKEDPNRQRLGGLLKTLIDGDLAGSWNEGWWGNPTVCFRPQTNRFMWSSFCLFQIIFILLLIGLNFFLNVITHFLFPHKLPINEPSPFSYWLIRALYLFKIN